MSELKPQKTLYNIPAGLPFAHMLAMRLLEETKDNPESLAGYMILLPSRRACRSLQEAFLDLSDGRPLLLPRLQTLGGVDEEELCLSLAGEKGADQVLALKPALSPLKRQLLLGRTIEALPDFTQGPDKAIALAGALGQLMDQIYTEGLDLANLQSLVPEDFAQHWQITIDFLNILAQHWPKILEEHGVMDGADRRNRLTCALAEHWKVSPPSGCVIAAGSTGSIPATAMLLDVVACLPKGAVVLPGLDQDMDEESWNALEEGHPQYGLKHLLLSLKEERKDVRSWVNMGQMTGHEEAHIISNARRALISEVMRPASTTAQWITLGEQDERQALFRASMKGLNYYECAHEGEEATLIATLMRETLEQPGKTAILVTSDRNLARRVRSVCTRWYIELDDSAGQSLDKTPLGSFLLLIVQAALAHYAPVALLTLLKHPYCRVMMEQEDFNDALAFLEKRILCGPKPPPGFDALTHLLELEGEKAGAALNLLGQIEPIMSCFKNGSLEPISMEFKDFLEAHIDAAEKLAASVQYSGADLLWRREEGDTASKFFSEITDRNVLLSEVSLSDYALILEMLMKSVSIRPKYGMHPRLKILGQIEARMLDADLVILAGLNEGSWPPDPGHDPFMSRSMRKNFGLPSPERQVGLAAHDFVQGFCAPRIIMTRSRKRDGAPSVPARWLQRLGTVLDSAGFSIDDIKNGPALHWVSALDRNAEFAPALRPAPTPPVHMRPRKLSVTRIETWLKDPYSIYARYILNLKKLEPLEKPLDTAIRGTLLHDVFDRFISAHKEEIPPNALDILDGLAGEEIAKQHSDPSDWSFWHPRFIKACEWFLEHEEHWRAQANPLKTEAKGAFTFKTAGNKADGKDFTLTAIADRIDLMSGRAAIIDYKSGGTYTKKGIKNGDSPQLSLEGFIVSKGGFEDIPSLPLAYLGYWILTGSATQCGKITELREEIEETLKNTEEGLRDLIETFDRPETPYYSLPSAERVLRFNDYEHLARVQEWAILGEGEETSQSRGQA